VLAVVQLWRSGKKSSGAGFADVLFENLIGIVKVADDQIEAGEIFAELRGQLRVAREESRQRTGIKRTDGIGIEAFLRERGNVSGPENLEMRARKPITKQLDRGQSEDEIADRAAADDEDPLQINSA
jgi:hypothetical protein